ncbi:MAG: hypothetical protein ACU0CO_05610 [Shimia sp.]
MRAFALIALLPTLAMAEPDRRVLVDWSEEYVEVFVSVPTADLIAAGVATPSGLLLPSGAIDFGTLRTIPADIGDGILARTRMAPGFESMSIMAHDPAEGLPFADPIDGSIAASVCNVPADVEALPAGETHVYMSAFRQMRGDALRLDMGVMADAYEVRVFDAGRPAGRREALPGPLEIARPETAPAWRAWVLALGGVLASALAAWGLWSRRGTPAGAAQTG